MDSNADNKEDELFARLLSEPEDALRDRWDALSEELDTLQKEEKALATRRERLDARRVVLQGIAQLRRVELGDSPPPQQHQSAEVSRGNGRVSPRMAALEIVESSPERVWDASSLRAALDERGFQTSASNVRMILQRLNAESAVQRVGHGRYQSARASAGTLPGVDGGDET